MIYSCQAERKKSFIFWGDHNMAEYTVMISWHIKLPTSFPLLKWTSYVNLSTDDRDFFKDAIEYLRHWLHMGFTLFSKSFLINISSFVIWEDFLRPNISCDLWHHLLVKYCFCIMYSGVKRPKKLLVKYIYFLWYFQIAQLFYIKK